MSNYSKTTDFASKDALLTGDPNKIVKGTEINDEFDSIQTAVNSKANVNNTALTGIPTAPTAAFDTQTTQLATTAFVRAALAVLHPVGSVYINANTATNPSTLLGFGTWAAFGAGKVIVGLDAGDAAFDTAGETGGSKDAVVVSHTHTVNDPGHAHPLVPNGNSGSPGTGNNFVGSSFTGGAQNTGTAVTGITAATAGVSATNANLQPYVVVYMWKRTA